MICEFYELYEKNCDAVEWGQSPDLVGTEIVHRSSAVETYFQANSKNDISSLHLLLTALQASKARCLLILILILILPATATVLRTSSARWRADVKAAPSSRSGAGTMTLQDIPSTSK